MSQADRRALSFQRQPKCNDGDARGYKKEAQGSFLFPKKRAPGLRRVLFFTDTLRLPVFPRQWPDSVMARGATVLSQRSLKQTQPYRLPGKEEKWLDGADQLPCALHLLGGGQPKKI